jgi:hypothetical protein
VIVGLNHRGLLGTFRRHGPRNRGFFGPVRRFGGGITAKANGRWAPRGGNAGETFWKGKPPKGESHERRRCETKPARDSRE